MFLAEPESSDATERIYKSSADSLGFVMNLTRAWAWRPDVYEAFAALRAQLTLKVESHEARSSRDRLRHGRATW